MRPSQYLEALRTQLEPGLVCRCGLRNTLHVKMIRIVDAHGQTLCACGATGPTADFHEGRD